MRDNAGRETVDAMQILCVNKLSAKDEAHGGGLRWEDIGYTREDI